MDILIDADVIAYRALGAATKTEYLLVNKHNKTVDVIQAGIVNGQNGPQRAREAAKKWNKTDDIVITKNISEPPLSHVITNIENIYSVVNDQYRGHSHNFYLSGDGMCWRTVLYPEYKGQRPPRPVLLPKVRDYLKDNFNTVHLDQYEADDLISMAAHQSPSSVIVSVDKDFLQIPGTHFNPFTKKETQVGVEEAEYNLWFQVLIGDSVDNIKGVPGIGPMKAESYLRDMPIEEMPYEVYNLYMDSGMELSDMLFTWKLVKLLDKQEEINELPYWYEQVKE